MLKKAPTLSDVKKSIFRTKQQVLVKIGKSEQTVDMDYKVEREKFDERAKNLKELEKSLSRYEKALRELTSAHNEIYSKFQVLFEPSTSLYNTAQNSGRISNDIDVARQAFEEINRERVQKPLHDFLMLCRNMERRCVERSRRLTDMDRYNQDYQNFLAKEHKGEADPVKLNQLKEKAENMSTAYHALNQEIMEDFGHMDYNRNHFIDSIFASFVDGQAIYFKKTLDGVQSLERDLQEVDRNLAANVSQLITSDEETLARKPPEAIPADAIHYSTGHTPANPYYAPPGAHQATAGLTSNTSTSTSTTATATAAAPPQPQPQPQSQGQPLGAPPSYVEQTRPPSDPSSSSSSLSQAPPAPVPSTGAAPAPLKCRGLYPFAGLEAGELPFQPNDILTILNQYGDWWEAELRGRRGIIPSNYVELI